MADNEEILTIEAEYDPLADQESSDMVVGNKYTHTASKDRTGAQEAHATAVTEDLDLQIIADDIWMEWRRAAVGVMEAAVQFVEAEERLSDSKRVELYELLPFHPCHHSKVRMIAEATKSRFRDEAVRAVLPASFHGIYQLATLEFPLFKTALETGKITPDMTLKEIAALKGRGPRTREGEVLLYKLWRDDAFDEATATDFRHRLLDLCGRFSVKSTEPSPRGKRKK
jgi:hypothetical protein